MGNLDITKTDTTNLDSTISNYSVDPARTDGVNAYGEETTWQFTNFSTHYGYYKNISKIKQALDTFATYIIGQGYTTQSVEDKLILEHIDGFGEDTFLSILWNMIVISKINGDSFCEIIRDPKSGKLVNLKPLDPSTIKVVCNRKGRIIRYEQVEKTETGQTVKFKPEEIFHLCNNRVADNIHGTSNLETLKTEVDIINEAIADLRRIMHRSTIRVLYVEEEDKTRFTQLKSDYAEAIKYGEVLILPGKPADNAFQDLTPPAVDAYLNYIKYHEDSFYRAAGIPKEILGGTPENTEASAKVGVIVFEPLFTRDITKLELDIWNQLYIKISFNKQPSLMGNMQADEAKNTGQIGFQPNDTTAGSGKA